MAPKHDTSTATKHHGFCSLSKALTLAPPRAGRDTLSVLHSHQLSLAEQKETRNPQQQATYKYQPKTLQPGYAQNSHQELC